MPRPGPIRPGGAPGGLHPWAIAVYHPLSSELAAVSRGDRNKVGEHL